MVDRDARDATVTDFLEAAEGVVVVDSSTLSFEETVETVLGLVGSR